MCPATNPALVAHGAPVRIPQDRTSPLWHVHINVLTREKFPWSCELYKIICWEGAMLSHPMKRGEPFSLPPLFRHSSLLPGPLLRQTVYAFLTSWENSEQPSVPESAPCGAECAPTRAISIDSHRAAQTPDAPENDPANHLELFRHTQPSGHALGRSVSVFLLESQISSLAAKLLAL